MREMGIRLLYKMINVSMSSQGSARRTATNNRDDQPSINPLAVEDLASPPFANYTTHLFQRWTTIREDTIADLRRTTVYDIKMKQMGKGEGSYRPDTTTNRRTDG